MARIYKPDTYNNSYNPQSTSYGFRPVKAVDQTKQIEAQSRAQLTDLKEAEEALKRQQVLDQGILDGRWTQNKAAYKETEARMRANQTTVNGLMQLSQSFLKTYGTIAEIQAKEADFNKENTRFWGDGLNPTEPEPSEATKPAVETPQQNTFANAREFQQAVIASEKAAVEVGGEDQVLTGELRVEQQEAVAGRNNRIVTGLQASMALPGYMNDFMKSDEKLIDPITGQAFTPATASSSAQLAYAQQKGFEKFGREFNVLGLDGMAKRELLTVAKQIRQTQFYSLSAKLNANQTEATILSSKEAASVALSQPGADVGTIVTELTTGLLSSGKYNGNPAAANLDAVKHVLAYAESMKGEGKAIIEALEKQERTKGNKYGTVYRDLIQKSKDNIDQGIYADATRQEGIAAQQIRDAQSDRLKALETATTQEQIQAVNLEYYTRLSSIPGYQAQLERIKIEASNYNYDERNIIDIKNRRLAGEVITNTELQQQVLEGHITLQEANGEGYRQGQQYSADEMFAADEGKLGVLTSSRAAASSAITNLIKTNVQGKAEQDMIIAGTGGALIDRVSKALIERFRLETAGKNLTLDDKRKIWEDILTKGQQELKNITYDTKTNKFNTGSFNFGSVSQPDPSGVSRRVVNGKVVAVYSTIPVAQYGRISKQPATAFYLTPDELSAAHDARINNKKPPQIVIDKAEALGLPWEELYKKQAALYNKAELTAVEPAPFVISTESYGQLTMQRIRDAIIGKESGADYGAVNPDSGALGYAQVMPNNLPVWSKRYVGRIVSQREFLRSPAIQKQVINGHMIKLIQDLQSAGYKGDTLVRRLAAIWYSGDGNLMNSKRKEYYNGREYPSIYDYTMDILARVKRGT